MLRHVVESNRWYLRRNYIVIGLRSFTTRDGADSEEELSAARRWLAKLNPDTIPRTICDVTFSRSSGPGGQNVNKYALEGPAVLRYS